MRNVLFLVSLSALALAETITVETIAVDEEALPAGHYMMSEEEAAETESITIQDRLQRDVAFTVVPDIVGDGAVSFRGLNSESTVYVEDGIPLYRNVNGAVDTRLSTTGKDIYMNDGSGNGSFGVSPMGGEVKIASSRPVKSIESRIDGTVSTNDEYLYGYVGSRMDNVYVQADADVYHRSNYDLSDDYEPTPLQGKGNRINSDKIQQGVSLKSGIYLGDTHLAAKLSLTQSEYGQPPNVYTDLAAPVWDAYSRMLAKR